MILGTLLIYPATRKQTFNQKIYVKHCGIPENIIIITFSEIPQLFFEQMH